MHMRRISKALCAALSLMLIVNLTGFEAMASEVDSKPEKTVEADEDKDTADKDIKNNEDVKEEVPDTTPVIDDTTPEPKTLVPLR